MVEHPRAEVATPEGKSHLAYISPPALWAWKVRKRGQLSEINLGRQQRRWLRKREPSGDDNLSDTCGARKGGACTVDANHKVLATMWA